jgi:hypothetical protein
MPWKVSTMIRCSNAHRYLPPPPPGPMLVRRRPHLPKPSFRRRVEPGIARGMRGAGFACCARVLPPMDSRFRGNDGKGSGESSRQRTPTSLDSGLRRNDGEGHKPRSENGAVRLRWSERSTASCDTHAQPSVNGDGAVWPKVEQEVSRLFQKTSSAKACRVGGLDKAISLGSFSLGQQREGTRAPAGVRKPAAGEQPGDQANTKTNEGRRKTHPSSQPSPRRGEGAKPQANNRCASNQPTPTRTQTCNHHQPPTEYPPNPTHKKPTP